MNTNTAMDLHPPDSARHKHESFDTILPYSPLYVRFQAGPHYEDAYLCLDDGEPDCNVLAKFSSWTTAKLYIEAQNNPSNVVPIR